MLKSKIWRGMLVMLVILLAFTVVIIGCSRGDDDEEPGPEEPPPPSVDDFADLEPIMAVNPNRAALRVGGTTVIGIPDYLLPAESQSVPRAVTAVFKIHDDDTNILQIISQNGTTCTIKGLKMGSARVIVTVGARSVTMLIAIAPSQQFYTLPAAEVRTLGTATYLYEWWKNPSNKPDNLPNDFDNYTSEPTYQIAWNWRNKGSNYGFSGQNCGIDLLAYYVDPGNSGRHGWVRTTFGFGGWHYDLNGETNQMTNGVQVKGDVKLELKPEFVYDRGVPYLQIRHILTNTGTTWLTEQKFGASADVMIYGNDRAGLTHLAYGALMTNGTRSGGIERPPTLKLRLVCQNLPGVVDDVSTLWLGRWRSGSERDYIYVNQRESIADNEMDTAMNFSYQHIDLNPGESKTFIIRYTQVQ